MSSLWNCSVFFKRFWMQQLSIGQSSESSWVLPGDVAGGRSPVPALCSGTCSEARSRGEVSCSRHLPFHLSHLCVPCHRSFWSCNRHHGSFHLGLVATLSCQLPLRSWHTCQSNWEGAAMLTLLHSVLWLFASMQGHGSFCRGSKAVL